MGKNKMWLEITSSILSIGFVPIFRMIRKARRYKRLEQSLYDGKITLSTYNKLKEKLDQEYNR